MNLECLKAACFANFSGKTGERPDLSPIELTPNSWDGLWNVFRPTVVVQIDLPGVETFSTTLEFQSLKDFNEKGLENRISLLQVSKELKDLIASTHVENPLPPNHPIFLKPEMELIKAACGKSKESGQVVDLLSMVDIGEEEDSLGLHNLLTIFSGQTYDGRKREKVIFDLNKLETELIKQVTQSSQFLQVHASWQTLKFWSTKSNAMKLDVIDCDSSELCDAFYLNYVKPDSGQPLPLDLAFTLYSFDQSEDSRHQLLYLGKMAESISVPFLGNTGPGLFGAKTEKRIGHIQDFTGKFSQPEYAKWRKLKDETGSDWIFLFVNPFTLSTEDPRVWIPPAAWGASLIRYLLTAETWPGELLGPFGRMEYGEAVMNQLTEAQINDLSYNGFCAINKEGDALRLSAMMALASLKIPSHAQTSAAALVPFTLAYRFFSGLCARSFLKFSGEGNFTDELKTKFGLKDEDIVVEEGESGPVIRISAPFGIFGIRPDFVIG